MDNAFELRKIMQNSVHLNYREKYYPCKNRVGVLRVSMKYESFIQSRNIRNEKYWMKLAKKIIKSF